MIRRTNLANTTARDDAREWPLDVRVLNTTATALFALVAVIIVAGVVVWLVRQPVFSVRSIRIDGDVSRNSVQTIRANALPQITGNYFTINLRQTQRAFQAVPWVRRAVVSRLWPNRLAVSLEEHHAAALWTADEGSDQLVNTFGEVFHANVGDVEDESLPTLQGPDGSAARVLSMYRALKPHFDRMEMTLQMLSLSGRGSWHARFDSGAEIELGRGTEPELVARVERFTGTVSQVMARYQRPLLFADLRHNDGYALRLKGITTTALPAAGSAARN